MPQALVGVFGGSGFYTFLEHPEEIKLETAYGPPSDAITIGQCAGIPVAFLPRHGREHQFPPHKVPYAANLAAFKELGVQFVIGPCAAGSLQARVKPGDFVVLDQFVDRTWGRQDTVFNGPKGRVAHLAASEPYCSTLRAIAQESCKELSINCHGRGTAVVIQGPRFSTTAESRWFSSQGWEVVNMTQYPECYLAREMAMCYVGIALITDYDVGLEGRDDVKAVTIEEVIRTFNNNNARVKDLIFKMIEKITKTEFLCDCRTVLKGSIL